MIFAISPSFDFMIDDFTCRLSFERTLSWVNFLARLKTEITLSGMKDTMQTFFETNGNLWRVTVTPLRFKQLSDALLKVAQEK